MAWLKLRFKISHCENTAHGNINLPFISASKLAAIRSTSLKYRLQDGAMHRLKPCLSPIPFQCAHIMVSRVMEKGQLVLLDQMNKCLNKSLIEHWMLCLLQIYSSIRTTNKDNLLDSDVNFLSKKAS